MSVGHQFGRGVVWMAFGNWTEQVVNFAVFIALARLLGAEALGLVAMAIAFVILCEFLVRESVSEFLIAAHDPSQEDFNAVFWALLALGGVLTLALAALALPIARAYGQPEVAQLIWWLSPTILMIAPTAVPVAVLRRAMRFEILSIRAVAGYVAGGIVGVGMALTGWGVWSLVGQRLAQIGLDSALAWGGARWWPSASLRGADLRRILHFGGQVLGLRAAELAFVQTPIVLSGAILGPASAGYYAVAWRLVETLSHLVITPLRTAAQPAFAALRRQGAHPGALLADILRLSTFLVYPTFTGLGLIAMPLLTVAFGADWGTAAPALSGLSVLGLVLSFDKIQQVFGLALHQIGRFTLLTWLSVVLAIGLGLVAARLGLAALAWASVLALTIPGLVRFAVIVRLAELPAGTLLATHLRPLIAASVMAMTVLLVARLLSGAAPAVSLLVSVATGAATYTLAALILMRDRIALAIGFLRGKPVTS